MSRQLLQEYRFVAANGPESERRWRKSLTPYQRTVLERALAAEAEQQAHPLPSDPAPVEPVRAAGITFTASAAGLIKQLDALQTTIALTVTDSNGTTATTQAEPFAGLTDAQAIDQILRACGLGTMVQASVDIDGQLDRLAVKVGLPVESLRERFRGYAASWPVPPSHSIDAFCRMVLQEVLGPPLVVDDFGPVTAEMLARLSEPPKARPRPSFKAGLRRPWWERGH
jgi:hypothetical protein